MNTPPWLLRIIASYLMNRSMILSYKGSLSSQKELLAGSPQGAFLGGLIFMIKFNGAFLRPSIPRDSILKDASSIAVKFVDDGSAAASVALDSYLVPDTSGRPRPLNFREHDYQ